MRADLIEAYVGRREDELRRAYDEFVQREASLSDGETLAVPSFDSWAEEAAEDMILRDDHRTRLETYLLWNGIGGYTTAIYEIANGGGV